MDAVSWIGCEDSRWYGINDQHKVAAALPKVRQQRASGVIMQKASQCFPAEAVPNSLNAAAGEVVLQVAKSDGLSWLN